MKINSERMKGRETAVSAQSCHKTCLDGNNKYPLLVKEISRATFPFGRGRTSVIENRDLRGSRLKQLEVY